MSNFAQEDRLALERRKRLAAEKLLSQKSDELYSVNKKLAAHADKLSYTVIEQREENQSLVGQNTQTRAELDIATQKANQAERRLWDSLEAIDDGFAVFDAHWRLVAANASFMRLFEEIEGVKLGATYEDILVIAIEEGLIDIADTDPDEWIDAMIARWEQPDIPEIELQLFNGTHLHVSESRTEDGDVVCMIKNITDTILREAALREARDEAQAASRAKSAFLAKMSHEIRTPMNGVVGMADLLLDGGLEEEQTLFAETIKTSAEALLVIINDILDFSKLEAERIEFREEPVDLEAMIIDLMRLSGVSLRGRPIDIFVEYPFDAPSMFATDPGRMRQVLTNLLGNAIKFTSQGHVALRISVGPKGEDGKVDVAITVEDSGIGIPADKLEHIFGDFNQVEDEKNRKHEGTGLGLAITRGLVERMGGKIWVESELEQGSKFNVVMPMRQVAEATPPPAETLPPCIFIDSCAPAGTSLAAMARAIGIDARAGTDLSQIPAGTIAIWTPRANDAPREVPTAGPILLLGMTHDVPEGFEARNRIARPLLGMRQDILTALTSLAEFAQAPAPIAPPTSPETSGRVRMLAAEDNKTNQLVFRKMLKALDLDMTMVENGRELVAAFENGHFDMIFTDISMPEMDGLEASQHIRDLEAERDAPRIPIVAMTAHALDGDQDRIKEAGIDYYMTKPLKKAALIDQIEALCPEGKSLQQNKEA